MKVFSDLIGRIFNKDDDKAPATKKKLEVKDTSTLDPEVAAQKAAEAAREKAQEKLASKASSNSIDVTKMLDQRAKARTDGIDWRNSIVDLMKICGMNSSYSNRCELAKELGYQGEISKSKSAAMNIWLHKEMMRQIVANGGKVPKKMLA